MVKIHSKNRLQSVAHVRFSFKHTPTHAHTHTHVCVCVRVWAKSSTLHLLSLTLSCAMSRLDIASFTLSLVQVWWHLHLPYIASHASRTRSVKCSDAVCRRHHETHRRQTSRVCKCTSRDPLVDPDLDLLKLPGGSWNSPSLNTSLFACSDFEKWSNWNAPNDIFFKCHLDV